MDFKREELGVHDDDGGAVAVISWQSGIGSPSEEAAREGRRWSRSYSNSEVKGIHKSNGLSAFDKRAKTFFLLAVGNRGILGRDL